ncbi:MAG: hypothetical protein ACK5KU_07835 [Beutenbergiaceae bacterium]
MRVLFDGSVATSYAQMTLTDRDGRAADPRCRAGRFGTTEPRRQAPERGHGPSR